MQAGLAAALLAADPVQFQAQRFVANVAMELSRIAGPVG
jgi:hypothetical protein